MNARSEKKNSALPEPLDAGRIDQVLSPAGLTFELHDEIDSTNRALAGHHHRHRHFVLAEHQTAGRGRQGRTWFSPKYSSICLSFGYVFPGVLEQLRGLSLAVGVAAAETLRLETGLPIQIKWPNDLMRGDKKLGGVLIEVKGSAPARAIIGLGLNVCLPAELHESEAAKKDAASGRGWTDLVADGNDLPSRTRLLTALAIALDRACQDYARSGFQPFAERWPRLDVLVGRMLLVTLANGEKREGMADGIAEDGSLWLQTDLGRIALNAAEVSVRGR